MKKYDYKTAKKIAEALTDDQIMASAIYAEAWKITEKRAMRVADELKGHTLDDIKHAICDHIRTGIMLRGEDLADLVILPGTEWAWETCWDSAVYAGDECGDTYGGITMNAAF